MRLATAFARARRVNREHYLGAIVSIQLVAAVVALAAGVEAGSLTMGVIMIPACYLSLYLIWCVFTSDELADGALKQIADKFLRPEDRENRERRRRARLERLRAERADPGARGQAGRDPGAGSGDGPPQHGPGADPRAAAGMRPGADPRPRGGRGGAGGRGCAPAPGRGEAPAAGGIRGGGRRRGGDRGDGRGGDRRLRRAERRAFGPRRGPRPWAAGRKGAGRPRGPIGAGKARGRAPSRGRGSAFADPSSRPRGGRRGAARQVAGAEALSLILVRARGAEGAGPRAKSRARKHFR